MEELEGLEYDELVLDQNVHKITGKLTKLQGNMSAEVSIDAGATWLVTGLGYLREDTPDTLIQESLGDTSIISKTKLLEFIKSKSK
jgi:copper chaperone CopZ